MKRYLCMPRSRLERGVYAIEAVQPDQIEAIRCWRNAQIDVLRQTAPISPEQQIAYYAREIWPALEQPQPSNVLVSYFGHGSHIGYGGLVHIAWPHFRAEVSFLLDPAHAVEQDGADIDFINFLALMKELAFGDLKLHRLSTETYAIRPRHIAVLAACGFRQEGVLREQVYIHGKPVDSFIHGCLRTD
jgi:hypothetical protein